MMEFVNLISAILAIGATVYLFIVAGKCDKGLKTSLIFLGVGVLVATAIHSLAEFMETAGYLAQDVLFRVMPIFVLVGSIFLIIGTYQLYKVIKDISKK